MALTKQLKQDLRKRGYSGSFDLGDLLRFLERPEKVIADYYDKKTDTIQRKEVTDVSPHLWSVADHYQCELQGFDEYGEETGLEDLQGLELCGQSWEEAVAEAVCWYLQTYKICESEADKPESLEDVQREFEATRHLQRVK